MSCKIILITASKGGVGKTSSVAAIGDVLARKMKKKVLLMDCDAQCNLSSRFGYNGKSLDNSLDVYLSTELAIASGSMSEEDHLPVKYFFNPCKKFSLRTKTQYKDYESLQLICGAKGIENLYNQFSATPNSDMIFREMLVEIKEQSDFDYVLIDTQPSVSSVLQSILLGVDYVITPVTPNRDSFIGANDVGLAYNRAKKKKSNFKNHDSIEFLGAFINKYATKTVVSEEVNNTIEEIWKNNPIFETIIPYRQAVEKAEFKWRTPVTSAYPADDSSIKFNRLTQEIVERINEIEAKKAGAVQ